VYRDVVLDSYQSIGRLFVLEDYHGLMEKLQKEMETLDEQIITKQVSFQVFCALDNNNNNNLIAFKVSV
jgi:hypothetical protein